MYVTVRIGFPLQPFRMPRGNPVTLYMICKNTWVLASGHELHLRRIGTRNHKMQVTYLKGLARAHAWNLGGAQYWECQSLHESHISNISGLVHRRLEIQIFKPDTLINRSAANWGTSHPKDCEPPGPNLISSKTFLFKNLVLCLAEPIEAESTRNQPEPVQGISNDVKRWFAKK